MGAGLARHVGAHLAIERDQPEGVGEGAVRDVQARPRPQRQLQRLRGGAGLGHGRVRAPVLVGIVALGAREDPRQLVLHDLLQLAVEHDRDAAVAEPPEGVEQVAVGDAREAPGVVLEERELERADAAVHQLLEHADATGLRHRAVEADVHHRLVPHLLDLGLEAGSAHHRRGQVVRHVHDGGHASGRRGRRGGLDALGVGAPGVDMGVHQPRHHVAAGVVAYLGALGGGARLEHRRDLPVATPIAPPFTTRSASTRLPFTIRS